MNKSIVALIALFVLMMFSVQGLVVMNDTSVDQRLLDSLNNNYYSFKTVVYNASWQTAIHYTDTALITFSPDVTEVNRIGAFAIDYQAIHNNFVDLSASGIPDNFTISFIGSGSPQIGNCTDFLTYGKCIVWYRLTNKVHYDDNTSFQDVYQEDVTIQSNIQPWNMSNLTFSLFQFESPEAMTFREKVMANMSNNTLTIQGKAIAITGYMGDTVKISYEIVVWAFWFFKIGILIVGILMLFTIPLKFVDFIDALKKKYGRK